MVERGFAFSIFLTQPLVITFFSSCPPALLVGVSYWCFFYWVLCFMGLAVLYCYFWFVFLK